MLRKSPSQNCGIPVIQIGLPTVDRCFGAPEDEFLTGWRGFCDVRSLFLSTRKMRDCHTCGNERRIAPVWRGELVISGVRGIVWLNTQLIKDASSKEPLVYGGNAVEKQWI